MLSLFLSSGLIQCCVPGARRSSNALVIVQQRIKFISKVALFRRLPPDKLVIVACNLEACFFGEDDVIIRQGDPGCEFFLVEDGEAIVAIDGGDGIQRRVAVLRAGDYFGEMALLRNEPRTATITAGTSLTGFKISRDKFRELGLSDQLQFPNRKAVGGGGRRQGVRSRRPAFSKSQEELELICRALAGNRYLQALGAHQPSAVDESRLAQLAEVAWREDVPEGTDLITQGDADANHFYIVQQGRFDIFRSEPCGEAMTHTHSNVEAWPAPEARALPEGAHLVSSAVAGDSFGELALLHAATRAATVQAAEASVVWVIDRADFKDIIMTASAAQIDEYVRFLENVPVLAPLIGDERRELARALVEVHFTKDEVILQQGELGNTYYLLFDGEVSVTKDGVEQRRMRASFSAACHFGERALINHEPRAATVTVVSETAKALVLDRESFDVLLGPLEDIIKEEQSGRRTNARIGGLMERLSKLHPKKAHADRERIDLADLTKIGLLGYGAFGAVELFEHSQTGQTFALKSMSKGFIVETGTEQNVMNEKAILAEMSSDFIVKFYESYSSPQYLQLLMEPALGGELHATYSRKGFYGSERHARFYSAGVVLAFEHLHSRRAIHRDLKPENLLLTDTGRVKLTDMGLAKFTIGKTYTTCGTPDYFAPEVIAAKGHTKAVDWWALGILIFELMSGHAPFESSDPMRTYQKVMRGVSKLKFPSSCLGSVGEVIRALLKRQPSERLPMRLGGIRNLTQHAWYVPFDWDAMATHKLEPPYVPTVKSHTDISNFAARQGSMPPHVEYEDDGTDWDEGFATL